MDIAKKFETAETDGILSGNQLKFTRVYRRKPSTVLSKSDDGVQTAEDYETIPPSIVAGVLSVLTNTQTQSFYHFTRALSAHQCLEHCLDVQSTGHSEQCLLAVAKAVTGRDGQTGRQQLEYECSFYDYTLNFTTTEHQHGTPKVPPTEVYQLMTQSHSESTTTTTTSQFRLIDTDSEPVRYAIDSYEPISTFDGANTKDECLNECRSLKAKNKLHAFFKSMDCQMVVVSPRVIRNGAVIDVSAAKF